MLPMNMIQNVPARALMFLAEFECSILAETLVHISWVILCETTAAAADAGEAKAAAEEKSLIPFPNGKFSYFGGTLVFSGCRHRFFEVKTCEGKVKRGVAKRGVAKK